MVFEGVWLISGTPCMERPCNLYRAQVLRYEMQKRAREKEKEEQERATLDACTSQRRARSERGSDVKCLATLCIQCSKCRHVFSRQAEAS